jgi:AraC-like DNA-binding protein
MSESNDVIVSGNLATAHRTITGALGLMEAFGVTTQDSKEMIQNAGLPAHAFDDPSFPISANQHLELLNAILGEPKSDGSVIALVFLLASELQIENFGVVGLIMKYSESYQEVLRAGLAYPELNWGHSRIVVARVSTGFKTTFTMEQPKLAGISPERLEQLRCFCLLLDMMSTVMVTISIIGDLAVPIRITLPFCAPSDWSNVAQHAPCPIEFNAESAQVFYPFSIEQAVPINANSLWCRNFEAIAQKLSSMLSEGINHTERVSRWLWAYTPPLSRAEIATQLAMSERSLTRKLKNEGTSYKELYNHVQTERAKNFLRNSSLSISDIADRLGYSEPAVFTRAFATQTAMAPLKWRKINLLG